jgi:hypothetical protein
LGNKDTGAGMGTFLTRLPVYSLVAFITLLGASGAGWSQTVEVDPPFRPIESLKGKSPALPDLSGVVSNLSWVQAAGKALFWDQLVGSDTVACATCHFPRGRRSAHHQSGGPRSAGGKYDLWRVQWQRAYGVGAGRRTEYHAHAEGLPLPQAVRPNECRQWGAVRQQRRLILPRDIRGWLRLQCQASEADTAGDEYR